MYERAFDTGWESISQEEAMLRAFALGVDAAFGNAHQSELERLMGRFHRGLIQIAYDEGRTRADDELNSRGSRPRDRSGGEFEPGEYEWEIWEDLVTDRLGDEEAFETVRVPRSRDSLPGALDRPDLLGPPDTDEPSFVEVPRFLLR
ncbi:MAG: hypothetical protein ABEJ58_04215 [Halodesulfurarchaeum sp.]